MVWERKHYDRAVAEVDQTLSADDRFDATLRIIVEYQRPIRACGWSISNPPTSSHGWHSSSRSMRERLERLTPGSDAALAAATAIRVAISHYLVRSDDADGVPRSTAPRGEGEE